MASVPNVDEVMGEIRRRDLAGVLDGVDDEKVSMAVGDAIAWVDDQVPESTRRLASGALNVRTWKKIVCDVVLRRFGNPEGYTNESDGVYSHGINPAVASGDMRLTDSDLRALRGSSAGTVGTIAVGLMPGWPL